PAERSAAACCCLVAFRLGRLSPIDHPRGPAFAGFKWSPRRKASAASVSVGFALELEGNVDVDNTYRFWRSWYRSVRSTQPSSGESAIRVAPSQWWLPGYVL